MKSYILNYSRVFRQKKIIIKCVLVNGKQMSLTPLSHSNLIFTICHIKAQTHSKTVGIHATTGDFGQDLQIKNYNNKNYKHTADRVSARIRLPVCSVETVMIAHRLGR